MLVRTVNLVHASDWRWWLRRYMNNVRPRSHQQLPRDNCLRSFFVERARINETRINIIKRRYDICSENLRAIARSVAASYKPPMLVTRVRLPACAICTAHNTTPAQQCKPVNRKPVSTRAAPGIEPGTSRTLSENHTTRPSSQLLQTHARVA